MTTHSYANRLIMAETMTKAAGYLSSFQIQKLFWRISTSSFGPTKACQRRLRLLTKHGYVRRIELPKKRQDVFVKQKSRQLIMRNRGNLVDGSRQ